VDGCFWHGCPLHVTWPLANGMWWREKIELNRRRDEDTNEKLIKAGWRVVRIWEHDEIQAAANIVASMAGDTRVARVVTTHGRAE
jgi:DNA mismatch endonuclease (patch repair protein)